MFYYNIQTTFWICVHINWTLSKILHCITPNTNWENQCTLFPLISVGYHLELHVATIFSLRASFSTKQSSILSNSYGRIMGRWAGPRYCCNGFIQSRVYTFLLLMACLCFNHQLWVLVHVERDLDHMSRVVDAKHVPTYWVMDSWDLCKLIHCGWRSSSKMKSPTRLRVDSN